MQQIINLNNIELQNYEIKDFENGQVLLLKESKYGIYLTDNNLFLYDVNSNTQLFPIQEHYLSSLILTILQSPNISEAEIKETIQSHEQSVAHKTFESNNKEGLLNKKDKLLELLYRRTTEIEIKMPDVDGIIIEKNKRQKRKK